MVVFLGYYAAAELSHFVEIVPRVLVSAVKWKKFGKKGFTIWSIDLLAGGKSSQLGKSSHWCRQS